MNSLSFQICKFADALPEISIVNIITFRIMAYYLEKKSDGDFILCSV
ncbi:hypothetical protein THF1C08_130105 [Vibrio jasicida]|uniref:Uncharacterized protein n=1 Tax=Vibrio jasicida TaxID=766224 RepID=A0AAU9QI46_9VIBR|nr:hypothetical protein THF1C08_130105 [Vibrio jasicida]CAH1573366.1 hypothetical protein THF1A12_120103 [Vibrio jasicida]